MGRVALDGTKLEANASKHKAMSYGRLVDKEQQVEAEIAALEAKAAALLADAEATDEAEDATFGVDGKDMDLPAELDRREKRLARLQAARAQIEAEAADKARRHAEDKERRRRQRTGTSDQQAVIDAGEAAAAKARPKPKAQANFTDPDSRIMKNSDGAYIQAYNAQIVDEARWSWCRPCCSASTAGCSPTGPTGGGWCWPPRSRRPRSARCCSTPWPASRCCGRSTWRPAAPPRSRGCNSPRWRRWCPDWCRTTS